MLDVGRGGGGGEGMGGLDDMVVHMGVESVGDFGVLSVVLGWGRGETEVGFEERRERSKEC